MGRRGNEICLDEYEWKDGLKVFVCESTDMVYVEQMCGNFVVYRSKENCPPIRYSKVSHTGFFKGQDGRKQYAWEVKQGCDKECELTELPDNWRSAVSKTKSPGETYYFNKKGEYTYHRSDCYKSSVRDDLKKSDRMVQSKKCHWSNQSESATPIDENGAPNQPSATSECRSATVKIKKWDGKRNPRRDGYHIDHIKFDELETIPGSTTL